MGGTQVLEDHHSLDDHGLGVPNVDKGEDGGAKGDEGNRERVHLDCDGEIGDESLELLAVGCQTRQPVPLVERGHSDLMPG